MMAKKKDAGKLFEEDIKASIPTDFFVERYKDDTAGFKGVANPADFRLYKNPLTFLIECKSHKGKSLPLAKIRNSQLKGMGKAANYNGVVCGFFINFRDLEETYYVSFWFLERDFYIKTPKGDYEVKPDGRKSVPVEWCREFGVRIPQRKKVVRYSYDFSSWLGMYF